MSILPEWPRGFDDPEQDDVKAGGDARERARPRPRPYRRTFQITSGDYEHGRMSRVGLTLDLVLAEELDDYRAGMEYAVGHGATPDEHAESEEDRVIWEAIGRVTRAVALIRPRAGGPPDVIRFDGGPTPPTPTDGTADAGEA